MISESTSDSVKGRSEPENLNHSEDVGRALGLSGAITSEAILRRSRRLSHFNRLIVSVSQTDSIEACMRLVANYTREIMAVDRASIALLTDDGKLELFALDGVSGIMPTGVVLPLKGSMVGEVVSTGRPIHLLDCSTSEWADARHLLSMGLRASVDVPLIASGRVLGTLNTAASDPTVYDSDAEETLVQIATILSCLLEKQRLYDNAVEAKRDAELANRAKTTFLSQMTHELRTPMNGVIGMLELLEETTLTDEQIDLVRTIRTSSDILMANINAILDFSKIEAGKLVLEESEIQIQHCLENTLDLVGPQLSRKKLYLFYFIEDDVPEWVVQDLTRLRQILTNLLSNAVKFTEKGGIEVVVRAEELDVDRAKIHFIVKDTGIGIAKENVKDLFKPFSQLDSSITKRYAGTGLGLLISQRICQQMGGKMTVTTESGKGSTFAFSIVCKRVLAKLGNVKPNGFPGKHLLALVPSLPVERRFYRQTLSQWEMGASFCDSVDQAKDALGEHRVADMLLADIDVASPEKLVALRDAFPDLPVLVVTEREKILRCSDRYPTLTWVPKPINLSQLHRALCREFSDCDSTLENSNSDDIRFPNLAHMHPLKILVAEDNEINQKVISGILSKFGYEPELVPNGLEAVNALAERRYDVILMDIHMPEMDGLTATRQIRRQLSVEDQPHVIAVSGDVFSDYQQQCSELGLNQFLTKPICPGELADALRHAC